MTEDVPQQPPAGKKAGRRSRLALALGIGVLVLVGGGVVGYLAWRPREAALPVPSVDLSEADPEVAGAIRRARDDVLKKRKSAADWGHLGKVLHANGFLPEAAEAYEVAARLDPADADWPYLHALALLEGPRPEAAMPLLERAVQLAPHRPYARARLAETLLDRGHLDESEKLFDELLAGDPSDVRARFGLGLVAQARGDYQTALRHLEAVSDSPNTRHRAAAQRAAIFGLLGDQPAAERERRRLATLPRDDKWPDEVWDRTVTLQVGLDARLNRARDLQKKGDVPGSRVLLEETVQRYPKADVAWSDLGLARADTNDHAGAERALERSLELAPQKVENWLSLGTFLMQQQRPKEAERAFLRALALTPDSANAHLGLGDSRRAQGDRKGAAAAYRDALRYRPHMDLAAKNLAEVTGKE